MPKRTCSSCKLKFESEAMFYSGLIAYCSAKCGSILALKLLNKKREEEAKDYRKETRRRKDALNQNDKKFWKKKAQNEAFNPYIRLRDKDEPCISCSKYEHEIEPGPKGTWDCGHYLSVGAFEELRFEPLNAHKQCYKCNRGGEMWMKKGSTVTQNYRVNLIKKIGIDQVLWIEGPHEPTRYRLDDYKEIYNRYKGLIKVFN